MVILRTRNKITDFLMISAWASPFKCPYTKMWACVHKNQLCGLVGKKVDAYIHAGQLLSQHPK